MDKVKIYSFIGRFNDASGILPPFLWRSAEIELDTEKKAVASSPSMIGPEDRFVALFAWKSDTVDEMS